jgi:histone H3/H4
MNYLTEEQVDNQEALTAKRLALLNPKYSREDVNGFLVDLQLPGRPQANLIDLMHWVKDVFGDELGPKKTNLKQWIHNKIVIDGSFLEFCEQKGAIVECLYEDSVASWRSDLSNEHFMAQGVFLITVGKTKFIHSALFHKGNQNEDEVSFFIIVDNSDFLKYTSFRNEYDDWLGSRDRDHLEIHVVGGEGQPYEKNLSWDDLFLPEDLKEQIRGSVQGFLDAKSLYQSKGLPWKRGVLLYGEPGNGKTSTIKTIIANYDLKPVTVQTGVNTNDDTITEAFEYAQEQSPSLLYFEDLDTLLDRNVTLSHFLNLMDGVSAKDGIFVMATANNISSLGQAVTDRPSRFDRKWEVPLPDAKMATKYLKKWFGNSLSAQECKRIVDNAVKNKFSYSYLKELYISAAYFALAAGRKNPNAKDIKLAAAQIVVDKKNAESGFMSVDREEIGIR